MKKSISGRDREKQSLSAYIKLMRSSESVNRRIEEQKPLPAGLTTSQFAVLEALYHHGPLKQSVIAEKILKTPGNLTLVIDNLARAGLAERKPAADDRRAKIINLTDEGLELIRTVFPRMAAAITNSFSVLDDDELARLAELLKKLGRDGVEPADYERRSYQNKHIACAGRNI